MVERTFRLLDLLSAADEGLTFSELARGLGMSKGSLHGLLKTLEHTRAIELSDDRRYVLGPRVGDLAREHGRSTGLRRVALPALRELAATIGETVFLGQIERDAVRIVECVNAQNEHPALHISAARGTRVPLLAAALARVLLATWPHPRRDAFLRTHPLPRFTAHSVTDPQAFLVSVEEAARAGFAEDHQEYLDGVNAVAVPVFGPGGALVALLWVAAFATHLTPDAMREAGQRLRAQAETIAQALDAG